MTPDSASSVQANRVRKWEEIIIILATLAGIATGSFALFSYRTAKTTDALPLTAFHFPSNDEIATLTHRVEELEKQDSEIAEHVKSAPPTSAQIANLSVKLASLETQLRTLDDAIGQSPEKAVAVPILRKDLDNLRESYAQNLGATQAEFNRLYDQNKWFIGLMFTIALGVIGLAVNNFLQLRKS